MKYIFICFCSLLSSIVISAQSVAINNDGSVPDNSAILDLKSGSKGLLIPRMTLAQKNALVLPAKGLLIYQTDTLEGFYCNKGTPEVVSWAKISMEGSTGVKGYYVAGGAVFPTSTIGFLTPTISITITAGQKIHVTATRALGGIDDAHNLTIYGGWQLASGGPITAVGGGMFGLSVPALTRIPMTVSYVLENLAPGTYKVGMVGASSDPKWENNDWGYVSALVY